MTIYRSPEGETAIHALYDRLVAELPFETESIMLPTRFGITHILAFGRQDAPPLVNLHGGNSLNPLDLAQGVSPLKNYRVYALDTIGHPGKSDPRRLSPRDDSYGLWIVDVLDGLELQQSAFLAGSYGAGIFLRAAAVAPERISKAFLPVPSGIVSIPLRTMFNLLVPLAFYYLAPSRSRLRKVLRPMFLDEPIPEKLLEAMELIFHHVKIEPEMPRNVTKEEMAALQAPVLILAAENDRLFPGEKVVRRAMEVFPPQVVAEVIPGCPHYPSQKYLSVSNRRLAEW